MYLKKSAFKLNLITLIEEKNIKNAYLVFNFFFSLSQIVKCNYLKNYQTLRNP